MSENNTLMHMKFQGHGNSNINLSVMPALSF